MGAFGDKNGVATLSDMRTRIAHYRRDPTMLDARNDPLVGCRIVTQPAFWPRDLWIKVPASWSPNIVTGKGFDTDTVDGQYLWQTVSERLAQSAAAVRFGKPALIAPRLGLGAFRLTVTDSYERRCAVTGERTLPILDDPSTHCCNSPCCPARRKDAADWTELGVGGSVGDRNYTQLHRRRTMPKHAN